MADGPPAGHPRIASLDGLRGIAILLILLYHLTPGRDPNRGLESLLFKIAEVGWLGVDLFFVLSGYLITSILLRHRREGRSLKGFFVRRMLRIVPLYYLTLVVVLLIVPGVTRLYGYPTLDRQLPFWLYVSNYFGSLAPVPPDVLQLGHFWSLGVEMQFYLLWPFLILYLDHRFLMRLACCLLVSALAGRLVSALAGVAWEIPFAWTPLRMDGLLIGALVAVAYEDRRLVGRWDGWRPVAVAVVSGAFVFFVAWFDKGAIPFKDVTSLTDAWLKAALPLAASIFFGALLILALSGKRIPRLLSNAPLRVAAKYSYGIYVFHFLLAPQFEAMFHGPIVERLGPGNASAFAYFLVAATLSFLLAVLSFHLVERHFLALKRYF